MTFYGLSPLTGLILAIGTLAVLTAAHFLHRRYQRVTVPTLRFWSAALKRHRQDTLGGRWRSPLTWVLLCILSALVILGMLQPALSGKRGPTPYVIIVDCRASMALQNESGVTRLEQAQSLGREVLEDLAGPVGTTVITVHETAQVLTGPQASRTEALYQLKHVTCSEDITGQGMDQALELATALVKREPRTEVVVLTDHVLTDYGLSEPLRSKCHVLNLAEPVDNVAVLPPQVTPQPDGTYRLEVSLAHWGETPCDGKLMLMQGEVLIDSRRVAVAPGQIQSYDFSVSAGDIAETKVCMLCDEAFTQDNRTPQINWQRCRVFLSSDAPLPLEAAVTANPAYETVNAAEEADVCVTLASVDAASSEGYQSVQIMPVLCPERAQRQAWMVDLFTGPSLSPVATEDSATILMQTTDGRPLAIRTGGHPTMVTFSPALFDEQATFWKQAQFVPVLDAILRPTQASGQTPLPATCYSDLSQSPGAVQNLEPLSKSQASTSLIQWILWLALALGLIERLCYYRGKIV